MLPSIFRCTSCIFTTSRLKSCQAGKVSQQRKKQKFPHKYPALYSHTTHHHHTSSYIYTRTSSDVELQLTSWVSQNLLSHVRMTYGHGWRPLSGSVTDHLAGVQNKVGAHRLLKKCFTRLDSSSIFQIFNMHTFRVHMGALTHCSCDIKS